VGEQDLRRSKCETEAGGGRMDPPTRVSSEGGLGGSEQSPPLEMRDGGQVGAEQTRQLAFRARQGVLGMNRALCHSKRKTEGRWGAEQTLPTRILGKGGCAGCVGHEQSPLSLETRDGGQVGAERTLRLAF